LSRQHARIADVRRHFLHGVSSQLVQTHDRLCLEDLAVANLITNRRLTRSIGDVAWAEFARQLTYKAAWFGAELIVCDRWFASSKICSVCGNVARQMGLAERTFCCAGCGLVIDRDRNAAANLAAWAERSPCPSSGPPSGRPGDQRPWRGRHWPSSQRWRNQPQ
jgi:putative transposase